MFRIVCDPSSGSTELCLTEITRDIFRVLSQCLAAYAAKHWLSTRKISRVISVKHFQHSLTMDRKRSETCRS